MGKENHEEKGNTPRDTRPLREDRCAVCENKLPRGKEFTCKDCDKLAVSKKRILNGLDTVQDPPHCPKCGDLVRGDENGLCGECAR